MKEFKESDADEKEEIKMELQKHSSFSSYRNSLRGSSTTSASELNRLTKSKMTKMKVYESDSNDVGRRTSSSEGYFKSSEED